MATDFDSNELQSLLSELLNDTLTSEKHTRLESILQRSPQARQQWFVHCDIETGLKDWAATEEQRRLIALPSRNPSFLMKRLGLASLAATFLIAIALVSWFITPAAPLADSQDRHTETPVNEIAVLTHAVNASWIEDTLLPVGSTLEPSTIRLASGAILIEFFSGATAVLEGPAEFELITRNSGRLVAGKLSAHVPPQAKGFTIATSFAEVIDQGTDFGVSLTRDTSLEVHVFSGQVEVKSEAQSRNVNSGEAIQMDLNNSKVVSSDRSIFLLEQDLVQLSMATADDRLEGWREASLALSRDPATLLHLRFDTPFETTNRSDRTLNNSASGSGPNSGDQLVGGTWVSGRWPRKRGLLFNGSGDRIRLTVPQPMKTLSLICWVNIQSLPHWQNALFSTDSEKPGSIQWQLTKRGQLRLAIARDLGGVQSDWEAVESKPFLTEDRQRQWIMLASTFDGKTIRHYADSQLVGSGDSFTPKSLHIETSELGNWIGNTQRNLHAVMDEFIILSRALSASEIEEIHRNGKP